MDIIPSYVLELVEIYWEALVGWFSKCFFERIMPSFAGEFLAQLDQLLDLGPLEKACAAYHHQEGAGADPDYDASVLVRTQLLRQLFDWSFEQTWRQIQTNLVVRWFVGLPLGEPAPSDSTQCRFEKWVRENQFSLFFDETLAQIETAFPEQRKQPHLADTFAMQANAAKESLITKLRHTCYVLLKTLKKREPEKHRQFEAALPAHPAAKRMLRPPKQAPEFALDKESYQQRVQEVVLGVFEFQEMVHALLPGCSSGTLVYLGVLLGDLDKVIKDEVKIERDEQGQIVCVSELAVKDKDSPLLGSATDREATYRVHDRGRDTQLGYNAGILATKDGLIRTAVAKTGSYSDQDLFPDLVAEHTEHTGQAPDILIADRAAGSGKTRARIEEASDGQTQVVAHLMPYDRRTDRFVPGDFILSEDGQVLTCPNGKSTAMAYAHGKGDGRQFRFQAELCQGCPFNPHENPDCLNPEKELSLPLPPSGHRICRDPEAKPDGYRLVFISDYRDIIDEALAFNQTQEFEDLIALRPRVERIVAELTRYNGARRAHGKGEACADFQLKMSSMAYNLKWWVRRVQRANAPPKKRRTTETQPVGA